MPSFTLAHDVECKPTKESGTRGVRCGVAAASMCSIACGRGAFADSEAMGHGENPQWLYTLRLEGRDLWGADTDPTLKVSVEAFEAYLEPVLA